MQIQRCAGIVLLALPVRLSRGLYLRQVEAFLGLDALVSEASGSKPTAHLA